MMVLEAEEIRRVPTRYHKDQRIVQFLALYWWLGLCTPSLVPDGDFVLTTVSPLVGGEIIRERGLSYLCR